MNKALKGFMKAPFTSQLGMVVVMVYAFVALAAPLLAPFGETEIVGDQYEPWGSEFLLGTDNIGRDMLTRLIYGARNTVGIAFVITSLAFIIGGFTGMLAATLGGWIDQILSRVVDVLMAIPGLVFVLLVLSFFGTAIPVLIIVIAIFESTRVFRLTRAVAMNVEVMDYVEISKLRGESMWWIVWSEILPNTTAPLVAEFGVRFTYTFLFITALSFLGLGIQPPIADWGGMVRENAVLITFSDFTPLLPAAAIALLTVSVNFVIDWVLQKASGLKE
ncbi:MAG: ABC transporter permease [Gammaproteobacteria bacterium]|jgi:peptide/nickel transport system permease protein|nr:ABC transporter permease [Gammaproteobacteria bacterium]|tara:strand:+ start:1643 stop:2470 length:828 start_codon:yes stop_codon:yes gene_type:complete